MGVGEAQEPQRAVAGSRMARRPALSRPSGEARVRARQAGRRRSGERAREGMSLAWLARVGSAQWMRRWMVRQPDAFPTPVSTKGFCLASEQGPQCRCDSAWKGDFCATSAGPCGTDHGGCHPLTECLEVAGGVECGPCPAGYEGDGNTGCANIDDCTKDLCQNGGVCVDLVARAVCNCPPGFFGVRCELTTEALAAGDDHICALLSDGTVNCWGSNVDGQSVPPRTRFVQIDAGSSHTCGIRPEGSVACWGGNAKGQSSAPEGALVTISAGLDHTCGIRTDGSATCWGDNSTGQSSAPTGLFTAISAGDGYTCALDMNRSAVCWGEARGGELPPQGQFTALATGWGTLGLREDGSVSYWGVGGDNLLSYRMSGTFAAISGGGLFYCGMRSDGTLVEFDDENDAPAGQYRAVSGRDWHGCAIGTDGQVTCWGGVHFRGEAPSAGVFTSVAVASSAYCALDTGGKASCTEAPDDSFQAIAAKAEHCCGIRTDGSLRCWSWGADKFGNATPPTGSFIELATAVKSACAIRADGVLACWGEGFAGDESPPLGKFVKIALSSSHACALRSDGKVQCWGNDSFGQSSPPSDVFATIATGEHHSCGIRSNGRVKCWGENSSGEVFAQGGTFTSIIAGNARTCGIHPDGSVSCWGVGSSGPASPPNIPFSVIALDGAHTCGVGLLDAKVHCWGDWAR